MTEAPLWPDVLGRLGRREDLPVALVERAMGSILEGDATDAQIAGFALLLRAKGESVAELAALVRTMLSRGVRVELPDGATPVIDTCGTGGDRSHTINVSTLAALVVAGAGVRVAKHGNRAASSACGSADLLEHLGVVIDLGPTGVARCIEEAGIGFCFAQRFHPCMRFAGPTRKELGVATTFNFLGPLANPARVRHQVLGVSDPEMAERMAGALAELGSARALVFCGDDGLDELTTTTASTVHELEDGAVRTYSLDPGEYGFARAERGDLVGGDAAHNAEITKRVLAGETGAQRDVVVLNAAAALVAAGVATDLAAGIEGAVGSIDDGRASAALDAFVRASVDARDAEAEGE
ncbi:MAG: anthranilate phosphoribosyltransferase [Actinobacteria bacterium]|nr:anthranilate phosphoribosyltransferase [Actinomycetota bacterium]